MRLIVVLMSVAMLAAGAGRPRSVWIDTDPSVAPGGHEVDDGLALLAAFGSPAEMAIRGVSIVFGNAELQVADRIGRQIVEQFGPAGLRVYTGAGGPGTALETEASRALATALTSENLTILALGPATNIATVLKLHPELAAHIREIVAVAGRRPRQHFTAGPSPQRFLRDFNFEKDPDAFQVLLDSRVKLTFAPWEVSSKVWLTRDDLAPIVPDTPGLASMMPAIQDWLALWKTQFGSSGFNPFDTLAVGYVADPITLTCRPMTMSIERGPDDTAPPGTRNDKPYLVVHSQGNVRQVNYCETPAPEFKQQLLRRLAWSASLRRH